MPDLASAVANAGASGGTQMRVGTVRAFDSRTITVDIGGGTLLGMPYLRSYQPIIGDFVTCLGAGATWQCLGASAGSPPDNMLANPSFEADTVGAAPANWAVYHDPASSQTATVLVASTPQVAPANGSQCLSVVLNNLTSSTTKQSSDFVYSNPFPVSPGQTWIAAAWSRFSSEPASGGVASLAAVSVQLWWFANQGDVPPTNVSTTSQAAMNYSGSAPFWGLLTAAAGTTGSVVPGGANWGRVVLYSLIEATYSVSSSLGRAQWDSVVARRVT